MVFAFDGFELDEGRFLLRRDGTPVHAQPKGLRLLLHLVRNRHRLVTREELYQLLWPGERPAPGSLDRAVRVARRALADSYGRHRFIETVRGVGFRFVARVSEHPAALELTLGVGAPGTGDGRGPRISSV